MASANSTAYLHRYAGEPKVSGPSPEERAIKSPLSVREGLSQVIDAYAQSNPRPDWERLRSLDVEGDLQHLKQWFESLLASEPPNPVRGGIPTADMYVRGATYDYEDADWINRTLWYPDASEARSSVLHAIYEICYPAFDATANSSAEVQQAYREAMTGLLGNTAEYALSFTYAGLVLRWLPSEIDKDLFLGDAPERVLFTGFDDGD